jgi:hypothetical protein
MATVKTGGFFGRLVNRVQTWFREVVAELKRVVKPTPEETTQMMLVVVGFILVVRDCGSPCGMPCWPMSRNWIDERRAASGAIGASDAKGMVCGAHISRT